MVIGYFRVCLCVAIGFGAFVISERAASRQRDGDRIVVTYWEKWTGEEANAMRRVVDAFNRSQNRIFVKFLTTSNIAQKTLLATSGGNPPDIAGMWGDQVTQFSDIDALTDLTEMAREAEIRESDYIPSYWSEMSYRGRLYALPSSPGDSALYVNRALMPPEYSSPERFPKTLSEFDSLVQKVSRRNPDGTVGVEAFLPREGFGSGSWPYLFGGTFLGRDGAVLVNSPEDVKAWEWVHSFAERFGVRETQTFRSGFGNYSSPQNPFLCGKLATQMEGPWFSRFIAQYAPKTDWFAVPFPHPDGRPDLANYTVLNLNTLTIPRGAQHPREAFEFLRFSQRQDVMEGLCRDQQCNSPLSKVSESFFRTHPNKAIRLFDTLARSPRAFGPAPTGLYPQISSEVGNAVDRIDLEEASTGEALDDAQRRLDVAWAKYRRQVLRQ